MDKNLSHINALFKDAQRLEVAEPLQVTQLRRVSYLISSLGKGALFHHYLLKQSFAYFRQHQSLSTVMLLSHTEKTHLYQQLLQLIQPPGTDSGPPDPVIQQRLNEIITSTQALTPNGNWRRIWIHASRRTLEDPDLALLEKIAHHWLSKDFCGYRCYQLAQLYCCDYARLRFKPDQRSAARFRDIGRFFQPLVALHSPTGNP